MAKHTKRIETLRKMVTSGAPSTELMDYFFDELGEDDGFLWASRPGRTAALVPILEAALGGKAEASLTKIFRCRGTDLHHGAVVTPEGLASFFFFAKQQQGIAVLAKPSGLAYARFGLVAGFPIPAPGVSTGLH